MGPSQSAQLLQFDWQKIVVLCIRKRKQQKLTLEDVSRISGIPKSTILNFEDGLTNLTLQTIFRIITPLNIEKNASPHLAFLDWEKFVKDITAHREDSGISLDKMGDLAQVSYKVIKKFENCEKNIGMSSIIKILRSLKITQSRCFQKKPIKKSHVTRRKNKYGSQNVPIVVSPLLNWKKVVELCISTRHQLNLTQEDISKRTGLSRATIVSFESGLTGLNIKTVFKIFDALEVRKNIDELNLSLYFSILDWDSFVKAAIKRKNDLCLSRNELTKLSRLTFPVVTNFEKANVNIGLNRVIDILDTLNLLGKNKKSGQPTPSTEPT